MTEMGFLACMGPAPQAASTRADLPATSRRPAAPRRPCTPWGLCLLSSRRHPSLPLLLLLLLLSTALVSSWRSQLFSPRARSSSQAHVAKLRRLHGPLAAQLRAALAGMAPLPLLPLAASSLAAGEEVHAATTTASARLIQALCAQLDRGLGGSSSGSHATSSGSGGGGPAGRDGGAVGRQGGPEGCSGVGTRSNQMPPNVDAGGSSAAAEAAGFLRAAPSLFLNLWMAACKLMLGAGGTGGAGITCLPRHWIHIRAPCIACLHSGTNRHVTSHSAHPATGPARCERGQSDGQRR
jgi:hypothetical protein